MKPLPSKARDLTIGGVIMSVTALCWLVAPDARVLPFGFLASGLSFLALALYRWRTDA
jgi:hypothetical protein